MTELQKLGGVKSLISYIQHIKKIQAKDIAKRLNMSPASLSQIKNGGLTNREHILLSIIDEFGLTSEEVIDNLRKDKE